MKIAIGRRNIAVVGMAIAALTLAACVGETPAVASRVEALNINPPPPSPPAQPTLVWVPGHYNSDGAWVPGRWRKI